MPPEALSNLPRAVTSAVAGTTAITVNLIESSHNSFSSTGGFQKQLPVEPVSVDNDPAVLSPEVIEQLKDRYVGKAYLEFAEKHPSFYPDYEVNVITLCKRINAWHYIPHI